MYNLKRLFPSQRNLPLRDNDVFKFLPNVIGSPVKTFYLRL